MVYESSCESANVKFTSFSNPSLKDTRRELKLDESTLNFWPNIGSRSKSPPLRPGLKYRALRVEGN